MSLKSPDHKYHYKASIDRIIDGDTIVVTLDLGMNLSCKTTCRLSRINAPETRGEERIEGLKSEKVLEEWKDLLDCCDGSHVEIQTTKKGKFGRYIAEVWFRLRPDNEMQNLSDWLVDTGYAKYKEY